MRHEAKETGGTEQVFPGTPRREFLYSDDLADACVFLMKKCDAKDMGEFVNIGTGTDQTIAELATLVAEVVGFEGQLVFDTSKPDGTPQKLLDVSRLTGLGWRAKTDLKDGLASAHQELLSRFEATSSNELR